MLIIKVLKHFVYVCTRRLLVYEVWQASRQACRQTGRKEGGMQAGTGGNGSGLAKALNNLSVL